MRISDWSSDVCSSDLSGQGVEHQGSAFIVAHLSFAQQHDQRPALAVADGMELRVQTAFGASDTSGNSPFLSRLAAVRCALRWVASIINWSGFPRRSEEHTSELQSLIRISYAVFYLKTKTHKNN